MQQRIFDNVRGDYCDTKDSDASNHRKTNDQWISLSAYSNVPLSVLLTEGLLGIGTRH